VRVPTDGQTHTQTQTDFIICPMLYAIAMGQIIMSYDVTSECIAFFDCSVSDAIYKRKLKLLTKLRHSETLYADCLKNISLKNWILYTDILFR